MDGTILDTLEDLAGSLNHGLAEFGLPERSLQEVRCFVGNGIHKLVERGVPVGTDSNITEKVFMSVTAHYKNHCTEHTKPYNGITTLLTYLHSIGIKTAVVSNKPDAPVHLLCEQYFHGLFDAAVGEKPTIRKKPAPDTVNAVLKELDISREDAVYIGDSEVDIETANNAGMECISVSWGFRDAALLTTSGATCIVTDTTQLKSELEMQDQR